MAPSREAGIPTLSTLAPILSTLAQILLVLALVAAVWTWAVDLAYLDEWVLASDLAIDDPGALLARAWTPHNEHRLLVPRVALVALGRLTAWNVRVEIFLGVACVLAMAALVWRLGRRIEGRWQRATFRGLGAALVLGLFQVENLVWGWQLSVFWCVLAALTALVLLGTAAELSRSRYVAAALLGLVSSFSYGAGLMVWPAGLVVLAARGAAGNSRRGTPWKSGGLWLAIGASTLIVYSRGISLPPVGSEVPVGLAALKPFLHALAFVASPVLGAWPSAVAGVAVGLAAVVLAGLGAWRSRPVLAARGPGGAAAVWLGLVAFGLAAAAMIGLGRAELGLEQALSSRYTTLANVFWLGLLGLWLRPGGRTWAPIALAVAVAAGTVAGGAAALEGFVGQHRLRSAARSFLERGVLVEELSVMVAGSLEQLASGAASSCAQRTGVFRRYRGVDLDCRFEIWPVAVDGHRALPAQRFIWRPPSLRSAEGFAIPVSAGEVEGQWRLTRDGSSQRCLRGWAIDATTGAPVVEVVVAEGELAQRLAFRREARSAEASEGGGIRYVGLRGCWIPSSVEGPVSVLATTDRGTTGILVPR